MNQLNHPKTYLISRKTFYSFLMLITLIVLIVCALFKDMPEAPVVPNPPALYKASDEIKTMDDYNMRYQCARVVLSAGYPETPDMPKYEDYEIHNDWDIAMAVYLNGGSRTVQMEDGETCKL